MSGAPSPLEGLRVLDLAQAISGPFVGRIFADLGADVVKVEWPAGDVTNRFGPATGGHTGLFTHMNAGKRGVGVDLKDDAGRDLLLRLAARADVVLENFRPGVLDRAGLGYADLAAANPGLVLLSVSGFGRTSPESQRPAYAPVLHAESGILARFAAADGRPTTDIPLSLADQVTALHATVAVLAALRLREATGAGQHIDLSMLEAIIATDDHVADAIDGTAPADTRGYVWEATGGPVLVSFEPKALWQLLSRHTGLVDPSPPGATIPEKAAARPAAMAAWFTSFPDRAGLVAQLAAAGIAWGNVRDATTLFDSPSLQARPSVTEVDDHAGGRRGVVRMPYRFSAAASEVRGPAPLRGEHGRQVVAEWLGADADEVEALVAAGVLQGAGR